MDTENKQLPATEPTTVKGWVSQCCDDGNCAECEYDGECSCHCHPGARLWDELEKRLGRQPA